MLMEVNLLVIGIVHLRLEKFALKVQQAYPGGAVAICPLLLQAQLLLQAMRELLIILKIAALR